MPSPEAFAAFAAASLALLVVPGPAVLYIVTRSVQGRTAGLVSVLGIHTGSIVHVVAAGTPSSPPACRGASPSAPTPSLRGDGSEVSR